MRVLLISANKVTAPYPVNPIGLEYVAGIIAHEHEVRVVDVLANEGLASIQEECLGFMPDVIGVSIRNVDAADPAVPDEFVDGYVALVAAIRAVTGVPVILGGSGYSIFPDELLAATGADFGVVGEGEWLVDVLRSLGSGSDVAKIPVVHIQGGTPPLPMAWHGRIERLADPERTVQSHYAAQSGILNIQTKRGCPHRCAYCTYPRLEGRFTRRLSPGDVGAEARCLQDNGAKFLFVVDSTFNTDPEHNLAVAEAFIRHGLSIPWGAFFAPIPAGPGYYRRLVESGLTHVEFGTESLSDPVLGRLMKPYRFCDVIQSHREAQASGAWVAHYIMCGGPGETEETLSQTLDGLEELENTVFFFSCGVRIYPHTPLHEIAVREGQIQAGDNLLKPVFYEPDGLPVAAIAERVRTAARGRSNWIIGTGDIRVQRLVRMMYKRGEVGPLWHRLIG